MPHLRPAPAPGAWLVVFFLVGVAIVSSSWAQVPAQPVDPYTVRNVHVDVSAENVSVARDRAFAEGQRQAYEALMERLTAPADWPRQPKLSDADLQDIVLDVGIDQEKRSSVRYLATLSVRFKPDNVRKLLRGANIAYAEWRGRPVVVLPVYQTDDGPLLGEAGNPWRDAWKSGAAQGVVPLVAPSLEQTEGTLTAAQATVGGPEILTAVGQRFATQDVVLAEATPQRLDGGKVKVDVVLSGIGPVGSLFSGTHSYAGDIGEPLEMVLRRAVEDLAKTANDGWKSSNLLQFDRSASLAVTVPLTGLDDWLSVREKLTHSTPVRAYEVAALSKVEAALVLRYVGEQQQLEAVFVQNGLVLSWAADHWQLQNVTTRPTPGAR